MKDYKREFIEMAMEHDVLQFGEFTLKSGRVSPYFFNFGRFYSGQSIFTIGKIFSDAIVGLHIEFDVMFGAAYKGIPIATAVTAAMYWRHGLDRGYCYNRKEAKGHGEGGNMVGAPLEVGGGRVLIVDDVITAGTATREAADTVKAAGAEVAGVVIALDRQEVGPVLLEW